MMPSMFLSLSGISASWGVIDGRDRDVGVHRKAAALVVDNRLVAADHAATLKLLHAQQTRTAHTSEQACRLGTGGTAWLGHPFQACRGLRHRSRRAGSQPYVRRPDDCHCWPFIPLFQQSTATAPQPTVPTAVPCSSSSLPYPLPRTTTNVAQFAGSCIRYGATLS